LSPIRALLMSANNDVAKLRASRSDPVSAHIGRPAMAVGTSDAVAATDLRKLNRPGCPRLLKRRIGQPCSSAISVSFALGFSGCGRPTRSSNWMSSSLSL
jgi:hypothetical protein